jgi:WD40 repeat-containing protein SMU1
MSEGSEVADPSVRPRATLEVESADVIKLIIQFLKEHSLLNTLRALQEESQVTLNTVDNVERFAMDIVNGRWDQVLEITSTLRLPNAKLIDLFEQIVLELAELRELDIARAILRTTPAMTFLKKEAPDRYLRLEHILQRSYFDYGEAYPAGSNKERRRQQIAQALKKEVFVVPPSRLMALVTQALKWQQHNGLLPKGVKYDLFRGTAQAEVLEEEKFPTAINKIIKFGKKSHSECCAFSPDGQFLISGSVDGFVEVWDFDTGKLSKDLKYQADDDFMMHDDSVLSMAFNRDSELLATGDTKGTIKVWKVRTGACVRKFPSAHTGGITSLQFARDGTQLLSASFDQTLRIHGLKSGRTLKEFRGHTSYVNCAIYTEDGSQVISVSSDGTVKVWDSKNTDCVRTFKPAAAAGTKGTAGEAASDQALVSLIGITKLPKHIDRFLIVARSPTMYMTSLTGQVIQSYFCPGGDISTYCVSPKGNFIYVVAADQAMYCFNTETGKVEHVMKLHKKDVLGMAHHPHRNILASHSDDGTLKLWKP